MTEAETRKSDAKLILQAMMTVFLASITGLNGWALMEVSKLGKQVAQNTSRLDQFEATGTPNLAAQVIRNASMIQEFAASGPRYSRYDAEKDFGVLTDLLEKQGKVIDDHEGRIRVLEKKDR
jgi:hypothetical protein